MLVVDETGFLKQGRKSAGVKRQYSGTAGRIENCQIGVFLAYASVHGHAGLDRALYLPPDWCDDPARCAEAGVPASTRFQTKPQLALGILERALDAGVPAAWVTADEVYGNDYTFRRGLEVRDQPYVVAVKRTQTVSRRPPHGPIGQAQMGDLAAALPPDAWQRLNCGDGAQGARLYDWAYLPLRPARHEGWVHALLVRRHPTRTAELAYYRVYAPEMTPLTEVARGIKHGMMSAVPSPARSAAMAMPAGASGPGLAMADHEMTRPATATKVPTSRALALLIATTAVFLVAVALTALVVPIRFT